MCEKLVVVPLTSSRGEEDAHAERSVGCARSERSVFIF